MPFRDIADPEARATLTAALCEYCRENGINPSSPEYEDARALMVLLFRNHGLRTATDLKLALVAAIRCEQ